MFKAIIHGIKDWKEDNKHDKYFRKLLDCYPVTTNMFVRFGNTTHYPVTFRSEGSVWHYIKQSMHTKRIKK